MAGFIIQLITVIESVHMWNSCRARDNDFEASTAAIISFRGIDQSAMECGITRLFTITNETVFPGCTVMYATAPYASLEASQNTCKVTSDSFVNLVKQRVSLSFCIFPSRQRK